MAFENYHIPRLQREILLTEKLTNEAGCLNVIHMASAIYRVKCKNQGLNVLKNTLKEIIRDLENENENEDYYRLTDATLND